MFDSRRILNGSATSQTIGSGRAARGASEAQCFNIVLVTRIVPAAFAIQLAAAELVVKLVAMEAGLLAQIRCMTSAFQDADFNGPHNALRKQAEAFVHACRNLGSQLLPRCRELVG
jgi:hypothetical protein